MEIKINTIDSLEDILQHLSDAKRIHKTMSMRESEKETQYVPEPSFMIKSDQVISIGRYENNLYIKCLNDQGYKLHYSSERDAIDALSNIYANWDHEYYKFYDCDYTFIM